MDDNSFAYENITVEIFPEDRAYLMTEVDDEVDPVYMHEDEERTIVIKPKSQWYTQVFIINITLGATEDYDRLSNYSISVQVQPKIQKKDILFRPVKFEVGNIDSDLVLRLHFSVPLNRSVMLGSVKGRMLGLEGSAIEVKFMGEAVAWEVAGALGKPGELVENVQELRLKLLVPESAGYAYRPFKEQVAVTLLKPEKFVSLNNFPIQNNQSAWVMPSFPVQAGPLAQLGTATCVLPFLFLLLQLAFKFRLNSHLTHSYLALNFLQFASVFALYGIDLYPNMVQFWRGAHKFGLFQNAFVDATYTALDTKMVRNTLPLRIPKEFSFHLPNLLVATIIACIPFILAKLTMWALILRAKMQKDE